VKKLFMLMVGATLAVCLVSCAEPPPPIADLILVNGRIYTLTWAEPDGFGNPAGEAPRGINGWHPDAEAIAINGNRIALVGDRSAVEQRQGAATRVIDLQGATVLPGLIDSHVHLANLGAALDRVNLVGVATEAQAVDRVAERAKSVPKGQWIVGWGWDEGAWANNLPTMRLLSERVPDHPVILHGLHTFAVWGNRLAFERAAITKNTATPSGGEIKKDASGNPTGVLVNNASGLLTAAVPQPTPAELADRITRALDAMIAAGFTSVHEAGADTALIAALEDLEKTGRLTLPVYAMLAARDTALVDSWRARGPKYSAGRLVIRGVKAFYDGAMGSRGAFFVAPYSDRPDHSGVGGAAYGFDADRLRAAMTSGFQVSIHAIGDRANREALDFFENIMRESPAARETRPRIEHAQVLSPSDVSRFGTIGVIASMQPSHAVEDMAWVEDRIGRQRAAGAYAWRALRVTGARMTLNSDLPATDYSIFYGWHSAVTRTDRQGKPAGGWHKDQALTIEEAIRGWTNWAAYAEFREQELGLITAGRMASLTVMNIDPFVVGETSPHKLLDGKILMTIVEGKVTDRR
jgi:predicted amidohydrolase YtcJ